jgi:amino acid transporter
MSAGPPPPAAGADPPTAVPPVLPTVVSPVVPPVASTIAATAAPDAGASPPGASAPVTPGEFTPSQRPASFGRTALAVFWSFFGVRKRRDYESDAATLNPVHLIVAGVIGAALFVTLLLVLVNLVTRHR